MHTNEQQAPILVIEDDAALGELICTLVEETGIGSHLETSGSGALAWLALSTPPLILVDHSLPDMTADEFVTTAAGGGTIPPFVVMTGREDVRLAVSLMKLGARDYLVKDVSFLDTLPSVISRVLNQADTERRLKEAERQLKESEEKYRILVEMARDSIIVYAPGGDIIDCNGATFAFFAIRRNMLESMNIRDLFTDSARMPLDSLLFSHQPEDIDVTCRRSDGSLFPGAVHITSFPIGGADHFIIYIRDNTAQKAYEEELRYVGTHDPLTGLYNRAYFDTEMKRLEQGRNFPYSIIMADMDGLKKVNDTLGHSAGDCLIRCAAGALAGFFRSGDVVARIGGDEFAVILPGADEQTVGDILGRARNIAAECLFNDLSLPVSLSYGSATAHQGENPESLLTLADGRMYQDKKTKKQKG